SVYRDRAEVCHWTLMQADRVLCQTDNQRAMLHERFHRDGTVIHNPIDLDDWDQRFERTPDETETAGLSRYALWVGRADAEHKRPQVLLELARRCPEVSFLAIMNPRDDL